MSSSSLRLPSRTASDLLGIQANTAILYYLKIPLAIEHHLALEANVIFDGKIELDESHFGATRKGKYGRGAGGKIAVFGLRKRQGKVFTVVVKDAKTSTLTAVIQRKIKPDSVVYTDKLSKLQRLICE